MTEQSEMVRFTITVPREEVELWDDIAKRNGRRKSQQIRFIMKNVLKANPTGEDRFFRFMGADLSTLESGRKPVIKRKSNIIPFPQKKQPTDQQTTTQIIRGMSAEIRDITNILGGLL